MSDQIDTPVSDNDLHLSINMSDGRSFPIKIPQTVISTINVNDVCAIPLTCTLDEYDDNFIQNQKANVLLKLQRKSLWARTKQNIAIRDQRLNLVVDYQN